MQWLAIPRPWIDAAMVERYTTDNPAPEALALAMLCARIQAGQPWGKTTLRKWSGLSDWKARKLMREAAEWMDIWESETNRSTIQKPTKNQPETNRPTLAIASSYDDSSTEMHARKNQKPTARARVLSSTGTDTHTGIDIYVGQEPDTKPKEGKKGKNIGTAESRELWQRLNDRRKKGRQGAKNMKLTPPIAADLREGLRYATADEILHAYEYFLTSLDNRWWQDNGCDLDTFIRRKHLGGFVSKAAEWDSDIEKDKLRALTEMPF